MSCKRIEDFMRDNPGIELPELLRVHARSCPDCQKLLQQQLALEAMLRAIPRAGLPPYLATLTDRQAPKAIGSLWPSLAPAMALGLALAVMLINFPAPPTVDLARPSLPEAVTTHNVPGVERTLPAAKPAEIYPVWPPDGQAIDPEDMTIMVSIYPRQQGEVKLLLNGADVTASSTIGQQHISFSPADLKPGEHQVRVLLQQPDGSIRSTSWSFYLLEELS